jgi:hypothetical protein
VRSRSGHLRVVDRPTSSGSDGTPLGDAEARLRVARWVTTLMLPARRRFELKDDLEAAAERDIVRARLTGSGRP